ncbi:MAG: MMPL family transporter [Acidimicrobiaceae bacterium]|nr:MMPL family transporter [Acidimicrobiaceae bacterium]
MSERWIRAVVRHRVVVVVVWSVVAFLGVVGSTQLSGLLTTSLAVPGSGSARANQILATHFADNVEGTFTVVLDFKSASSSLHRLEAKIDRAASSLPTATVTQQRAVGGVLYANITTSMKLIDAARETGVLRRALVAGGLTQALVTGPPALQHDLAPILASDLHRGEVIAVILALALLLLMLGWSWAVLVPFLVAGATSMAAVGIVSLLARHFLMVLYIPNVIELIAFGLAVDYSLLMVHRFRREIAVDEEVTDAVVRTMNSAGRTVLISGVIVAVGLATLLFEPVPFVRSLGVAGMVVPLAALASTLTLQPALLSILGRRGVTPVGFGGFLQGPSGRSGAWRRIVGWVIGRPASVLAMSLVIVATMCLSMFWLEVTPGSVSTVPAGLESARAISLISQHVGIGAITPDEVVIDFGGPHRANLATNVATRLKLAVAISRDPNVFAVAIDTKAPFVDPSGRYERIIVVGKDEFGAESSQQLVHALRNVYVASAHFPKGTTIYVGGPPAQGVDFLAAVYGPFAWIVALVMLFAMLLLIRAFRSLFLALLAVVLDVISVGVAYGLLVVMFRFGWGSRLLGTYQVAQIEGWVPVFLFAMLFGLSMDYEVFIVARMREAWDRDLRNDGAIIEGLSSTGGVVTGAALIMVGALSGLVVGRVAGLQELGVGLALAVLVDATIVRGLILPSVMALLGRWNWWLPAKVAGPLRIEPSPLRGRDEGSR